jgi:hypothetical protein
VDRTPGPRHPPDASRGGITAHHRRRRRNDPLRRRPRPRPGAVMNAWFPCVICGTSFERTQKTGRPPKVCSPMCAKERGRKTRQERYRANPEETHRQTKEWRAANPEATRRHARDGHRRRYWSDPEKGRQQARDWAAANPEKKHQRMKRWRAANPEKIRALYERNRESGETTTRLRRWRAANPEKAAAQNRRASQIRRARARAIGKIERYDPIEIFERDSWVCGLCGVPVDKTKKHPDPFSASIEHIVPVSRGGSDTRDNVELAHLRCNVSRGTRMRDKERRSVA